MSLCQSCSSPSNCHLPYHRRASSRESCSSSCSREEARSSSHRCPRGKARTTSVITVQWSIASQVFVRSSTGCAAVRRSARHRCRRTRHSRSRARTCRNPASVGTPNGCQHPTTETPNDYESHTASFAVDATAPTHLRAPLIGDRARGVHDRVNVTEAREKSSRCYALDTDPTN